MSEDLKSERLALEKQIANSFGYKHLEPVTKNGDSNTKKGIIFVEDSGAGYTFLCEYLGECYPDIDITIVSVGGSGNFKYAYAFNETRQYDYAIFMYDRGKVSAYGEDNRRDLNVGVRKYKRLRKNSDRMKLYYFSPIAFESIPLSFEFLMSDFLSKYGKVESDSISIHKELVDFVKCDNDLNLGRYIISGISMENCIENAIEELTNNTIYEIKHHPSSISKCWWEECQECENTNANCNSTDYSKYEVHRKSKLELISRYSVLGCLTAMIDKIYGYKFRRYPLIVNGRNKAKLWDEIEVI